MGLHSGGGMTTVEEGAALLAEALAVAHSQGISWPPSVVLLRSGRQLAAVHGRTAGDPRDQAQAVAEMSMLGLALRADAIAFVAGGAFVNPALPSDDPRSVIAAAVQEILVEADRAPRVRVGQLAVDDQGVATVGPLAEVRGHDPWVEDLRTLERAASGRWPAPFQDEARRPPAAQVVRYLVSKGHVILVDQEVAEEEDLPPVEPL